MGFEGAEQLWLISIKFWKSNQDSINRFSFLAMNMNRSVYRGEWFLAQNKPIQCILTPDTKNIFVQVNAGHYVQFLHKLPSEAKFN